MVSFRLRGCSSADKIDFFNRFSLLESWYLNLDYTIKIKFLALCFALHFFTLLRWIRKKPCFSPKPPSSNAEKIFQTESYQYSDPHPWEPISMNFPLQKTDRKNLSYFSRYPRFVTFFVNREIMTFEVVKMTSYNGGVKLWGAVKWVLEEIFPNPFTWWKSRPIPFIKAEVTFFTIFEKLDETPWFLLFFTHLFSGFLKSETIRAPNRASLLNPIVLAN